jgi:two-component system sensor histidine kinase/response regulator
MNQIKQLENDPRIFLIQDQLIRFTQLDFSGYVSVSEKSDELDAIIVGMNTLGEELKAMPLNIDPFKKIKKIEDELELVNKELESFSYSVSHDLRAPLRAIDGYSKILEEDYGKTIDEEGRRLIQAIRQNTIKMGVLIGQLLTLSRLSKKELYKTNLNMVELVEGALLELTKSVKHNTTVKTGKLYALEGDYELITQVVINLLFNAIKFSAGVKNPIVEIGSEKTNNEIIYTVRDNGVGFDMRYADKLFGVFQRLHTTNEFEGTGMGLAIVKRIITRHGGKVWAKGEKDKGAIFGFSLPLN